MSEDLPFLRCIACGKVLANKWERYLKMLEEGISISKALDDLDLRRPCCRLHMMNPIKVVDRNVQSQNDVNKSFENNFETLSISNDSSANTTGALSDISSFTIIPEEEETDIELPPIPIVRKGVSNNEGKNIFRSYTAW